MADQKLTALTSIPVIDRAADVLYVVDVSAGTSNKVTPNFLLGISGAPVGDTDSQTLTNKTLGNTNTVTLKDTLLTLQDDGDATKQAQFQLSGITTGNIRTYTVPDASTTLVGTGTTQTLTNKTLTSPTINTATIVNPTLTTDAVTGFSVSNTGTVYGVAVTTGTIGTAGIANSAVDYTKVATGFAVQVVSTNFSALATGTTVVPGDDTIPQNTEGTQFMTQIITPKSTTNTLVIEVVAFLSHSAAVGVIGAIFQDSTVGALAASGVRNSVGTEYNTLTVKHTMTAGTVSATTFKFRSGGDAAGTLSFNGIAGARVFGGITLSTIVITEYKA